MARRFPRLSRPRLRLPAPGVVPTTRAVVLVLGLAPLALLIAVLAPGVWAVGPLVALVVPVLVLIDGWQAGGLLDMRVVAPEDGEVGVPVRVVVLAELARGRAGAMRATVLCDRRLAPAGHASVALAAIDTAWSGELLLTPDRRGPGRLDALWLGWRGPWGLARRVARRPLVHVIRIWPDLSPVRSPALQTLLRDSEIGLIARRLRASGSDLAALAEWEPGQDRRRIDWKASGRHRRLMARELDPERNNPIVLALDCGQAMCEPIDGLPRIDRAISAALTLAWAALKGHDRVALFAFAARPLLLTALAGATRDFQRLQRAAAGLDYQGAEPNFTLAMATLATRLKRRALVVVLSDFTDPAGAETMIESLGRLAGHHRVLFVVLQDSELADLTGAAPVSLDAMAMAVTAGALQRQRALVLERLRQRGVDVVETPWRHAGFRLIDAWLRLRRSGGV